MNNNISLEFFPPKTPIGLEKLNNTIQIFNKNIQPNYYSVTYGAGGSTQDGTLQAVNLIHTQNFSVAPHLSCIGTNKQQLSELILYYKQQGIKKIVALRGDLPSGMGRYSEYKYASDLVSLIRNLTNDWFHIEVAAYPEMHPQALSPQADLQNFITKVKAGADGAITQYFYNIDAYFRFTEDVQKHGINIPITAGIMPINNYSQLARFSESCGAEIPRWLRLKLQHFYDDIDSLKAFAADVVSNMCQNLLDHNIPLHFYTLNNPKPTMDIIKNLNININHTNENSNEIKNNLPNPIILPSSGGNVNFV